MASTSKRPKITTIPPKQLFVDLTQDDTKTPSPKHQLSSPSAPNAPSKTPSTRGTSSSSITSKHKSPNSSTSPSTNSYLNSPISPPQRVPPPPPTQGSEPMDITLTFSPITPLDNQFNTPSPSMPSPPLFVFHRKFDEKADDGYFLGYSLVSKAFKVFNTRRQQTKETYHITFDESPDAIKFTKSLVDNIDIAKSERYPPYEYLHPYNPSQRLEAIRVYLAFATYMNFIVYQMDVKSAFLNGKLKEEVYVKQPLGFERSKFPNHVCKLEKPFMDLNKLQEHVKTPMVPPNKLGPNLNGNDINKTQYRGMIGSLMYLTASRPDIQFSTCLYARYQANPKESQLITVKSIFRDHILKGDIGLHFIPTQYQLADIFTKTLDEPTFKRLIVELEGSKIWVSIPTRGIREETGVNTFKNAIRANYSNEYVASPSLTIIRPWFSSTGYNGEIWATRTLKKSCLPPRWRLLMAQII
ncbi:retrovirus-related pol polyprotein from transposon TNT 1-94 [Tanacetum coccineum]